MDNSERQRKFVQRQKEKGLKLVKLWLTPEEERQLKEALRLLRELHPKRK